MKGNKQQEDAIREDAQGRQVAAAAERAEETRRGMTARGLPLRRGQTPSPGVGESCAALNEARIALEDARQALAYRSGAAECSEVITLTAVAQVAVQSALDAARALREKLKEEAET